MDWKLWVGLLLVKVVVALFYRGKFRAEERTKQYFEDQLTKMKRQFFVVDHEGDNVNISLDFGETWYPGKRLPNGGLAIVTAPSASLREQPLAAIKSWPG